MSMFNLTERNALIVAEWNGEAWRVPKWYAEKYGVAECMTSEEIKSIHELTGCNFVLYKKVNGYDGTVKVSEI